MPQGVRFPEDVTVHEGVHNYFYGLIGSNEFEEAWLDEGLTTYMATRLWNITMAKVKEPC